MTGVWDPVRMHPGGSGIRTVQAPLRRARPARLRLLPSAARSAERRSRTSRRMSSRWLFGGTSTRCRRPRSAGPTSTGSPTGKFANSNSGAGPGTGCAAAGGRVVGRVDGPAGVGDVQRAARPDPPGHPGAARGRARGAPPGRVGGLQPCRGRPGSSIALTQHDHPCRLYEAETGSASSSPATDRRRRSASPAAYVQKGVETCPSTRSSTTPTRSGRHPAPR